MNSATGPAVVHVSNVHPATDTRIYVKECQTLARAGYDVALVAVLPPPVPDGVRVVTIEQRHSRFQRAVLGTRDVSRALRGLRHDVVHFHDPELLPLGLWLRLRGGRIIYDAHESLRDDVGSKPYLKPRTAKALARIAGAIERFVARRVDRVIAATPVIAAQLPPGATVVGNYPILAEWSEVPQSPDSYLGRGPVGTYVGGIIDLRCRDEMVSAAEIVHRRHPEFVLRFAGSIDPGDVVPDGPGVEYLGVLDRPAVAKLLAECRFGLVLMKPLPNIVNGLPTKFFEYLAAGLPVVVSRSLRLLCEIVVAEGCGIVVDESRPEDLARAIERLLDDPEEAFAMGQRGRMAVLERFSWESEAAKLVQVYADLLAIRPIDRSTA